MSRNYYMIKSDCLAGLVFKKSDTLSYQINNN